MRLQEVVVKRVDRLELLLKQMVKVLAANTNYATMITGPQLVQISLSFYSFHEWRKESF